MQVPDEVRKCVCFVLFRRDGVMTLAGTAFFVGQQAGPPVPLGQPAHGWGFTVTARHVIDGINGVSDDGRVYLRLNDRDGNGASLAASDIGDWTPHPGGPSVDVSVLPWVPPVAGFDHLTYTLDHALTDELIAAERISVGDEVFIPGLFVKHPGRERSIPIVRVGNIAAMPGEPVASSVGDMEAYLIEARSIGGLSGSPVFVNLGAVRQTPDRPPLTLHRVTIYLLGLMHGHWDVTIADPTIEAVNMGIAIVPPIAKVLEITNREEFDQMKKDAEERAAAENTPTMDSVSTESEFDRFEALTKELVNTPKSKSEDKPSA